MGWDVLISACLVGLIPQELRVSVLEVAPTKPAKHSGLHIQRVWHWNEKKKFAGAVRGQTQTVGINRMRQIYKYVRAETAHMELPESGLGDDAFAMHFGWFLECGMEASNVTWCGEGALMESVRIGA